PPTLIVCVHRRHTQWILNRRRLPSPIPNHLPNSTRLVDNLDNLVLHVVPPPPLVPERVPLAHAVAALVVLPRGLVPLAVRLTRLLIVLVPRVLRGPEPPRLTFLHHKPGPISPVARDPAASILDGGEVALPIILNPPIV